MDTDVDDGGRATGVDVGARDWARRVALRVLWHSAPRPLRHPTTGCVADGDRGRWICSTVPGSITPRAAERSKARDP